MPIFCAQKFIFWGSLGTKGQKMNWKRSPVGFRRVSSTHRSCVLWWLFWRLRSSGGFCVLLVKHILLGWHFRSAIRPFRDDHRPVMMFIVPKCHLERSGGFLGFELLAGFIDVLDFVHRGYE